MRRIVRTRTFLIEMCVAVAVMSAPSSATDYIVVPPVKAKGSGAFYRIKENRRWGYMDRQGKVVIAPRFDYAEDFFEGKALVRLSGKVGYINDSGAWQIPPRFEAGRSFQHSVAVASLSLAENGLIDSDGRFVAPPQYSQIGDFSEGFRSVWSAATVKDLQVGFTVLFGGQWGFVNNSGAASIAPRFDRVQPFTEGLAAINMGVRFDADGVVVDPGKWGFINTKGEVVIQPKFDSVRPFHSGAAAYWDAEAEAFGLIDPSGRIILNPFYVELGQPTNGNLFQDGFAWAMRKDRKEEYIRPNGSVAFQCPGRDCSGFSEGFASFSDGKKIGYLNNRGIVTIAPIFESTYAFSEGLARTEASGLQGYIDTIGKWIIPPRFLIAEPFVDGLALVRLQSGRWAYVDRSGRIVRENVWDGAN